MIGKLFWSLVVILAACSASYASDIRRVVTTLDANDRSTTLFDSELPLLVGKSGNGSANLWVTDSDPAGFSQQDAGKMSTGLAPPDNGTVLRVVEFPAVDDAKLAAMDPKLMMNIAGSDAPGRGAPVTNPLEHRTRTVDYAIVMSGEIDMMLDDKTVHLKPGDVVVQQATNHAWINRGKEPCRVIFVLMDSKQP
jgi:mannose-6-phosphate isomerase-like protein (cupin superfamily)